MSSACTPDETSTRCCGPPDSGGSISTVTGAASRSRPTAYGSLRSEPCHSASREQDVRRTSDLQWPGAELRLDRVDAACEGASRTFAGTESRRMAIDHHPEAMSI